MWRFRGYRSRPRGVFTPRTPLKRPVAPVRIPTHTRVPTSTLARGFAPRVSPTKNRAGRTWSLIQLVELPCRKVRDGENLICSAGGLSDALCESAVAPAIALSEVSHVEHSQTCPIRSATFSLCGIDWRIQIFVAACRSAAVQLSSDVPRMRKKHDAADNP